MIYSTENREPQHIFDVAIIGGGVAGMATAARLQAKGLTTIVCEAHREPGGCAGFFRRKGFAFDVGATTLVDFEPGGVGGELLEQIGMPAVEGEALPGYVAWLPDRQVTLYRDPRKWAAERLLKLGDSPAHQRWWGMIDRIAEAFWKASRRGIKMPLRNLPDLIRAARSLDIGDWPLVRHLNKTVGDSLRSIGLRDDRALTGLLSMLIEDTVHSTIDDSPLINAALGMTIRGAGLTRSAGGMRGFWKRFTARYRSMGGELKTSCRAQRIEFCGSGSRSERRRFRIRAGEETIVARQVVCALPIQATAELAPDVVGGRLRRYLERDNRRLGGAVVAFLGVPEEEVANQEFTHHQLLQSYDKPLGNGNNMFISVSSPGDLESAPPGRRAVMISTHCELGEWEHLTADEYESKKKLIGRQLVDFARRVYPDLGKQAVVFEIGTPQTYERFTLRPRGAVGGARQTLANSNQHAVPHDLGIPGFWLAGDATWPGLGTVACALGSRLVAEAVLAEA
ncbi:MAG TPA: NAD(P)/FAD-dependent oxidoreductase [Blastocatellia bacterium]